MHNKEITVYAQQRNYNVCTTKKLQCMHNKEITVYLFEASLTSGIMQILMKKKS